MDQPKRGRPSDYSADIATTICRPLAGGESLRVICADAEIPDQATVFRWLDRNEEFQRRYALACACLAEDLLDEILEIADDSSGGYVKKTGVDGKVARVVDRKHIEHRRLRIKARKWMLAHLAPKKYRYR